MYIIDDLCNVSASIDLMKAIRKAMQSNQDNPNTGKVFESKKELKHNYRQKIIDGHIILYWVDEVNKVVTVSYIFNTKANYRARLF